MKQDVQQGQAAQSEPSQAPSPGPSPADQLEVQLLHASSDSRIVLVQRRRGAWILDGALGEAATAEEAEDRARQRLGVQRPTPATSPAAQQTQPKTQPQAQPKTQAQATASSQAPAQPNHAAAAAAEAPDEAPSQAATPAPAPIRRPPEGAGSPPDSAEAAASPQASAGRDSAARAATQQASAAQNSPPPQEPPPADPEDWSSELAQLDLQLQRLGWDRSMESRYLERVFGHPSRNRITNYGDLLAYLQALERFDPGTDPASAAPPLRRSELLSQCDQLLEQLQWQPAQGRALLEEHFSRSSRQQLNDAQLLQFNMLLESELLGLSAGAVRA